jgi:hypothetical protein
MRIGVGQLETRLETDDLLQLIEEFAKRRVHASHEKSSSRVDPDRYRSVAALDVAK